MKFSVVIPAFNEVEYIARSIRALKSQNIKRSCFEIIVVDNNSTDQTFNLAVKSGADKIVKERKQGTNAARQRGYRESQGEIIVFLDADSEPPSNWLKKIEKELSRKGVGAVSGPYDYQFSGFKEKLCKIYTRNLFPKVSTILRFIFRKKSGVIIGGNFAVLRSTIEKIGGLPQLAFWGDDAAIAMLISRRVGKVVFKPELTIKSSSRRFEKTGFVKLSLLYSVAYLKAYFKRDYWR